MGWGLFVAKIRIQLTGQFQVLAGDGTDITPGSAKSRGLLCILCLSPRLVRSRRWIEGLLWSDRGEKQAQESLRTELSKMRRAFGASKDVLGADNMNISLDRSRVAVDILDEPYRAAMALREGDELFEGVLARSPGFDEWLRGTTLEQTERLLNVAEPRPAPVFIVSAEAISPKDAPARVLAESLASSIEQKIGEYTNVNVIAPDVVQMQIATGQRGLRLTIRTAMGSGGKADVFIRMDRLEDARRLDILRHSVPAERSGFFDREIADAVSYEAVQVVLAALHSTNTPATEADRADAWVTEAAEDIMSAVPSRLVRGKSLLDRVQLIEEENPRALAWRAMLAMTMRNERVLKDQWLCDEEVAYLQRRAFELAPRNGMVMGLAASVQAMAPVTWPLPARPLIWHCGAVSRTLTRSWQTRFYPCVITAWTMRWQRRCGRAGSLYLRRICTGGKWLSPLQRSPLAIPPLRARMWKAPLRSPRNFVRRVAICMR